MSAFQITVSYKDIFGKKPSKVRLMQILWNFAIEDCLILLSEINHRLSDRDNRAESEEYLINNYFSQESRLIVRTFSNRGHRLLSRSSLFVLLPWIYRYASKDMEPSETLTESSKRCDFFEAVYIADSFQDDFGVREVKELNREAESPKFSGNAVFSFLKDLMLDSPLDTSPLSKFGNYHLLYHEIFYNNCPLYQEILSPLFSEEKISMEDCFLTSFLFSKGLFFGIDDKEYTTIKNGRVDINLCFKDYPDMGNRVEKVLKLFSKDIFEMKEIFKDVDLELNPVNLKTLSYSKHRGFPIIKVSNGRYVSLDPFFMLEKSGPGLLWHVIKNNREKGNQLREKFGPAFEKYGATLIENTQKISSVQRTYDTNCDLGRKGTPEITDTMILEGDNLFLFEFKAVSIIESHEN